jgi:hypothetical protein
MNPKPGALTAIQVILFIIAGLAALGILMLLSLMGQVSGSQLQSATGMSSGAIMLSMLVSVAVVGFYIYVASTMGRGGYRTRTLVRVVVGVGVTSALYNMLSGQNVVLGLALVAVILVLNESASAKRWYEETEAPTPPASGSM